MAVAGGMDTIAKASAAMVLAIAVIVVVTNGVLNTQDLMVKTNAQIDGRRLMEAVEILDQKDLGMVQVNFGMRYDAVAVESENVRITEGSTEVSFPVHITSDLNNRTVPGTNTICLKQNGTMNVLLTCDPGEMTVPRRGDPP